MITPDHKLCYVDGAWAFFTTKPLTGEGRQWGDDWNDAPYEHNAGTPYEDEGYEIVKLAFDAELDQPGEGCYNSPYSVEMINSGAIAWLRTPAWKSGDIVVIPAGTPVRDFVLLVKKAGGKVYFPI